MQGMGFVCAHTAVYYQWNGIEHWNWILEWPKPYKFFDNYTILLWTNISLTSCTYHHAIYVKVTYLISVLPLVYKCSIYRFDDQETHSEYCIVDILGRVFVLDVSKNLTATKIKSMSCN